MYTRNTGYKKVNKLYVPKQTLCVKAEERLDTKNMLNLKKTAFRHTNCLQTSFKCKAFKPISSYYSGYIPPRGFNMFYVFSNVASYTYLCNYLHHYPLRGPYVE